MNLVIQDFIWIAGYFAVILFVGLYVARRKESRTEFFVGNRQVPWWAVLDLSSLLR
ncbi:MAG: hypothetical protein LR015_06330 [Verrucomicrobia bacterium]|nr:hypothetical protein [Verrucomicrobiota bacterium]